MTTVVEIEKAIHELPLSEAETLLKWMKAYVEKLQNGAEMSGIDDETFNATAQRVLQEHEPLLRKLAQ